MFVVCVHFALVAEATDQFLDLVRTQAATSLRNEPDCHQFDVCLGDDGAVFLYELYSDAAAFQKHLDTAHFAEFDRISRPMIVEKTVHTYRRAYPAG